MIFILFFRALDDSKWLVSGSGDQTARVWEVETGKQIAQLKHTAPVRTCGWALGDRRFFTITDAVMGNIPTVQIFNFRQDDAEVDPTPIRMFALNKSRVQHAQWVHLNESIYCACDDGTIRVYDAETGKMTNSVSVHRGPVNRINFDKYEATFVSASKDGTAKLFDSRTLQVLKTYDTGRPINCAVISPLKDHIIIGGGESAETVTTTRLDSTQFRIRFFHKVYETEICSVLGHFGTVNSVAISPDGKSFASGAEDGYVRLHHLPEEYVSNNDK